MSRRLGVPATQHAFEDVALQFQAMKMNLDPEVSWGFRHNFTRPCVLSVEYVRRAR